MHTIKKVSRHNFYSLFLFSNVERVEKLKEELITVKKNSNDCIRCLELKCEKFQNESVEMENILAGKNGKTFETSFIFCCSRGGQNSINLEVCTAYQILLHVQIAIPFYLPIFTVLS